MTYGAQPRICLLDKSLYVAVERPVGSGGKTGYRGRVQKLIVAIVKAFGQR